MNDRKWFIYLGDHHEGPFTGEQVRSFIASGKITTEYYAWCEGMPDWKCMAELPEFKDLSKTQNPESPVENIPVENIQVETAPVEVEKTAELPSEVLPEPQAEVLPEAGSVAFESEDEEIKISTEAEESAPAEETVGEVVEDAPKPSEEPSVDPQITPSEVIIESPVLEESPVETVPVDESSAPDSLGLEKAIEEAKTETPVAQAHPPVEDFDPSSISLVPVEEEKPDPKLQKKQEKEKKKKLQERNKLLGVETDGDVYVVGRRGGFLPRLIFKLVILGVLVGGSYYVYSEGYLKPVLENKKVNALLDKGFFYASPYLNKLVQRFPALGKWIRTPVKIENVSDEDSTRLKQVALSDLEALGPKVALAISVKDQLSPVFYITTNLPDNTKFDILLQGLRGTLLNYVEFEARSQVTISGKVGVTQPIKNADGSPIPRGQFMVYVYESEVQDPAIQQKFVSWNPSTIKVPNLGARTPKVVEMKSYFLGGTKDENYHSRLNAYHSKLREKSKTEIVELKQFSETLISQYKSTFNQFVQLREGQKTPSKIQVWTKFHNDWIRFNDHMVGEFQKWTPEVLKEQVFYSEMYQMTKQAGFALNELHKIQDEYFKQSKPDPAAFNTQLTTAVNEARNLILTLKDKIDQAEKLKTSETGMPLKPE